MMRSVLLLALAAAPLAAQSAPFEGVVSMNLGDGQNTASMQYQIRNGKVRMEPTGTGTGAAGMGFAMIFDPAAQKMLVLMPMQHMYMERDLSATIAAAQKESGKDPKITRTGKTEVVAGYTCEHVTVTLEDGNSIDSCVTADLGPYISMPAGGMARRGSAWERGLDNKTFPLKVQQNGKTIMEVTKVEKKSLDPSLFTPPQGFQKIDMPNFPGMGTARP